MISIAKRFMLVAVLAIIGTIAIHSAASAQNTYTCIIVNGCKIIIVLDPCGNIVSTQTDCGSNGSGTFTGPQFPPQGPVPPSVLAPQNITATVVDPTYGAVNTTLDQTRTSPATTIASNSPQSRYPLTVTIPFFARATISSRPGITYASRQPLNFSSNNVNSLNPFNGEVLTLQNPVDFYNTADLSQTTAFRLGAGSTVTLGTTGGGGIQ